MGEALTYAEAIAHAPGRELDALIAEQVFGLRIVSREWPCDHNYECGGWLDWNQSDADLNLPDESFGDKPDSLQPVYEWRSPEWPSDTPPDYFFVEIVPPYSTDDGAAVSVIRQMKALGWKWCVHDEDAPVANAQGEELCPGTDLPFYCYFQKPMSDGGVAEPEAEGETFASAVCRAALGAFCATAAPASS